MLVRVSVRLGLEFRVLELDRIVQEGTLLS